jgi:hypothetical protein
MSITNLSFDYSNSAVATYTQAEWNALPASKLQEPGFYSVSITCSCYAVIFNDDTREFTIYGSGAEFENELLGLRDDLVADGLYSASAVELLSDEQVVTEAHDEKVYLAFA